MYPRKRNGDEFYPKDEFIKDRFGRETYARDRKGNQLYPKRSKRVFARDRSGEFYYAKDNMGNEHYPIIKNKSVFIQDSLNANMKLALGADGSQRYPSDSKGNEYYLTENQIPFLMRNQNGEVYFAKNRKGYPMIPWNYLHQVADNEPLVYVRDSAGNLVYVKESLFPSALHLLIRCMCNASLICPRFDECITKCI